MACLEANAEALFAHPTGSPSRGTPARISCRSIMRVAAFTPLRTVWPHELYTLARGIRVIEKPSFDETTWSFWNLRRTGVAEGLERRHWFCVEQEGEWHERSAVCDRLTLLL